MIGISYGITVCDESRELKELLARLMPYVRPEDEVVILQDCVKTTPGVSEVIETVESYGDRVKRTAGFFYKDFGGWKNDLGTLCSKDWIFQIDADELPSEHLLKTLSKILEVNTAELFWVPRINTVEGITTEDIQRWHWRVEEDGRVNWPDYQGRIYRNDPDRIKWVGKVHEHIEGAKTFAKLPLDDRYALLHKKTIEKQRQQNSLYDALV